MEDTLVRFTTHIKSKEEAMELSYNLMEKKMVFGSFFQKGVASYKTEDGLIKRGVYFELNLIINTSNIDYIVDLVKKYCSKGVLNWYVMETNGFNQELAFTLSKLGA